MKFSDVGWTDITATTAIASEILKGLGYTPKITVLSVPVTYASMKNKDIDVFLGNWEPSMENDRKPYVEDKSVVVVGANLPEGAKYTLAVPQYTYDKGLKDFADIDKFKDSLKGKIYGIEPGNDGNRLVLDIIKGDKFGLKDFQLVESSEQGMLARGAARHHPQRGRRVPRLGAASDERQFQDPVSDRRRRQLRAELRRRGRLHQRARGLGRANARTPPSSSAISIFTVDIENLVMNKILTDGEKAPKAAQEWLKTNPPQLDAWLDGVTTFDGQPGLAGGQEEPRSLSLTQRPGEPPSVRALRGRRPRSGFAGATPWRGRRWRAGSPNRSCRSARGQDGITWLQDNAAGSSTP